MILWYFKRNFRSCKKKAITTYYKLLDVVSNKSVYLEEYARSMIQQEELHSQEVEKMIKTN